MKSAYKKIGSWIAIFTMLLTSFMPLISHAVESQNNLQNLEVICTSQGFKFVSTQNHSPDKSPINIKHDHCIYCSISSDKTYLLPINTQLGSAVIPTSAKFFLDYESPILQSYFRSSHPPQAPPVI
ncbi:exported protein of unknown function [Candidatus Methylopumilus planktonicus]|uniref:DUF2946 domain-containing protein n=1 Tax=Candidatus Methylopumilus planktonicus TaxID=1581557 RepID=A0A0D6EUZ3_9PROT|nr:DUF2946 domain-containing protein [Candidatus Methylopumilus planktonicus]CEZ19432.1 exported protein of unknown function [Candidatus Methylopumilus planktonicus]